MNRINYIFLDIDGVLNTRDHLKRQKKSSGECSRFIWCPVSCNNIIRLCEKYNAKIVISSDWRYEFEIERLRDIFESNGISEEYIVGTTPFVGEQSESEDYCRGHDVKRWLDQNAPPDATYLIIDDAEEMLSLQQNYFVQVSIDDGFANPSAFIEAVYILNSDSAAVV